MNVRKQRKHKVKTRAIINEIRKCMRDIELMPERTKQYILNNADGRPTNFYGAYL